MGIYRKTSGLIFEDKFDSGSIDSRYTLSPANAPVLDSGHDQLILPHTETETIVALDMPTETAFVFEVKADYVPTDTGDEGGILIWQDGYRRLEFLESKDSTSREYSKWRAERKGNRWTFFADRGSGWEMSDSATLAGDRMGVILKNPDNIGYQQMKLDHFTICSSSEITISNLPTGYSVYLCDPDGNSVASASVQPTWTGVTLEMPTLPYYGMLRVYDEWGVLLNELGAFNIYGGDAYVYGTDLRVIWKNAELSLTNETYLGTMYDNAITVQMRLFNPSENKEAQDISMGILQYLAEFGYQWADVCHDDGNDQPVGDFGTRINMGNLPPLGEAKFWLKVERKVAYEGIKPIHFLLDVTHK